MVKYEDEIIILGGKYISYAPNVIIFQCDFSNRHLNAWLLATWLNQVATEPDAVIKFSHFSSHPDTCLL